MGFVRNSVLDVGFGDGKGFFVRSFWAENHVGFLYEDMISFFLFVHSIHID